MICSTIRIMMNSIVHSLIDPTFSRGVISPRPPRSQQLTTTLKGTLAIQKVLAPLYHIKAHNCLQIKILTHLLYLNRVHSLVISPIRAGKILAINTLVFANVNRLRQILSQDSAKNGGKKVFKGLEHHCKLGEFQMYRKSSLRVRWPGQVLIRDEVSIPSSATIDMVVIQT